MAHFYGSVRGQRGEATRLGNISSGYTAKAASWEGAVTVQLWHDADKKIDMCEVWQTQHHSKGVDRLLYRGPVGEAGPLPAEGA